MSSLVKRYYNPQLKLSDFESIPVTREIIIQRLKQERQLKYKEFNKRIKQLCLEYRISVREIDDKLKVYSSYQV